MWRNKKIRNKKTKDVKRACGIIKIDAATSIDREVHIRESVLEFDGKAGESVEIVHQ